MTRLIAAMSFFLATTALAQPARDLIDAQKAVYAHERDLAPALAQAKDAAGALRTLTRVDSTLGNTQLPAGSAIDAAIVILEDYDRETTHRDSSLPMLFRRLLRRARQILEEARTPMPASTAAVREQLHHEVVHPMAAVVLQNAQHLNALAASYRGILMQLDNLQSSSLSVLQDFERAGGSAVPKQP